MTDAAATTGGGLRSSSSASGSPPSIPFSYFPSPTNPPPIFTDCDSEDGVELLEEPAKHAPPSSRTSGSKRSRAAEVHNLSERRRRSRINEKMKALQNLIPNSNKTDKASMLDEAIEYLKQLQLQVQMLSMRNGLGLHPLYYPGAMQPLQATQNSIGFGINTEPVMNMGLALLALNQESPGPSSFDSMSKCSSTIEPLSLPSLTNITSLESSFRMETPLSNSTSFQLTAPSEMFSEDMAVQRCADNSLKAPRSMREPLLDGSDHLKTCIIGKEHTQDMPPKDPNHRVLGLHFHGLQAGSFGGDVVKPESKN